MCRGLTASGGSQKAGGTFSASTALWPTAGRCTTIRAAHHNYWRWVREGENANEGKPTPELCCWSRACLAACGEGCAEDSGHAALRVGKRQGCGEEAVSLVIGSRRCRLSAVIRGFRDYSRFSRSQGRLAQCRNVSSSLPLGRLIANVTRSLLSFGVDRLYDRWLAS